MDEMKGQGMLRATRRQRTIARPPEVRGVGFFHGADVTLRFHPAEPDAGDRLRADRPARPAQRSPRGWNRSCPPSGAPPSGSGEASVEMIEHVMAALAGPADRQLRSSRSTPASVPGCDGSSRAFVEALDRAGIVEQDRMRHSLMVERADQRPRGGRRAGDPPPGLVRRTDALLSPRLRPWRADPRPELLRRACRPSRSATSWRPAGPSCWRPRPSACAPPGSASGPPTADLLIFGRDGVIGNELRYPDECARHKILDMVGDLALLGFDLHGFVVAYRSGHQTNAALVAPAARGRPVASDDCRSRAAPPGRTARSTSRGS